MSRTAAGIYSRSAGAPLFFRLLQRYRPRICPFERLIEHVPRGSSILDVGCGGGLFLQLLHSAGRIREGVGFDVSERAIDKAKTVAHRNETWLRFHHLAKDASFWPKSEERLRPEDPEQGAFDVVSMIDVMHHVSPRVQESFFEKAIARIRPGGILLYKDMGTRPRWRCFGNRMHDLVLSRQWIHYVPILELERRAHHLGLTLVASEDIPILWYAHELRVWRKDAVTGADQPKEKQR